jgi:hypothetical protein
MEAMQHDHLVARAAGWLVAKGVKHHTGPEAGSDAQNQSNPWMYLMCWSRMIIRSAVVPFGHPHAFSVSTQLMMQQ